MAKPKPEKFPGRHPIDVSSTAWLYEERGHIKVIAELRTKTTGEALERYLGTTHTAIPYKVLCRIVDRYRKAKRRRSSTPGATK